MSCQLVQLYFQWYRSLYFNFIPTLLCSCVSQYQYGVLSDGILFMKRGGEVITLVYLDRNLMLALLPTQSFLLNGFPRPRAMELTLHVVPSCFLARLCRSAPPLLRDARPSFDLLSNVLTRLETSFSETGLERRHV